VAFVFLRKTNHPVGVLEGNDQGAPQEPDSANGFFMANAIVVGARRRKWIVGRFCVAQTRWRGVKMRKEG
jgi:hypothetical protein